MSHSESTIKTWDKLAEKYQKKFMDITLYDASYDLFCDSISNESATLLEIGSGPGNITKYLLSKHPNYKILATDVAPSMIELARINNPSAKFLVLDARNIDQINRKFDAIMCGFCLPYLSKEESIKLITDSHALLNDHGILYFSFIENDYGKSESQTSSDGEHTMFVYYHQADYLQKALDEANFKTLELLRISYEKTGNVFDTHSIFIVQK
jgi:2-polyprenyl-3-methyl-5-hydroxy-6-metoxy-1,4-benzoquinol methylase